MVLSAIYVLSPVDILPEGNATFNWFSSQFLLFGDIIYCIFNITCVRFLYRSIGVSGFVGWFLHLADCFSPPGCFISIGTCLSPWRLLNWMVVHGLNIVWSKHCAVHRTYFANKSLKIIINSWIHLKNAISLVVLLV